MDSSSLAITPTPVPLATTPTQPQQQSQPTISVKDDPVFVDLVNLALKRRENVLLMGFGGSGKSYMIRSFVKYVKRLVFEGRIDLSIEVTATTGVAAVNVGGQTMHRFFGIGLGQASAERLTEKVRTTRKDVVKRLRATGLLIIDEVSMLSMELWDKLDFLCRSLLEHHTEPMGGLQVIACGDFLQLPPVNAAWVFKSERWTDMRYVPIFMTEPKRFTDRSYSDALLLLREGKVPQWVIAKCRECVQQYQRYATSYAKMTPAERAASIRPTMIYPHRARVDEENLLELEKLAGVEVAYLARDSFDNSRNSRLKPAQYEDTYENIASKLVRLKVGAQVMLTHNLDIDNGLCNGSRGVVVECRQQSVIVRFIARPEELVAIDYQSRDYEDHQVKLTRTQIPLILAWAQTIHKSQGSTLDYCVADVGPDIFTDGQAYVALSRARGWDSLLLKNFVPSSIRVNKEALEYVHELERQASERIMG